MILYDKRKKKLIEELENKEYRNAFVKESINIGIPIQIKTLREQRNWTQKDLEKQSGMKQARISLLEDINYSSFSLATLIKLSSAFDVGLMVRFVPLSDLIKWELDLSSESLKALSYEDDPYFKEQGKEEVVTSGTEQHVIIPKSETLATVTNLTEHILKTKSTVKQNKPEMPDAACA